MVTGTSSFLFTDSLYAVNKTTFQYVFVELYDNAENDKSLILNKTGWFDTDDIEYCFENSVFWKMQHNSLIKSGYVKGPEFQLSLIECKDYLDLDYIGIVSVYDLCEIDSISISIDYIETLLESF